MPLPYLQNIDTLQFIEEVKKRPQLWNNSVPGYNTHKSFKQTLWTDICNVIDPHFKDKSFTEQQHTIRLTQRRWKSLRDCFTRDIAKMKKEISLSHYRPYMYFKHLEFLLDVVDHDSVDYDVNIDSYDENTGSSSTCENGEDDTNEKNIEGRISALEECFSSSDHQVNLRESSGYMFDEIIQSTSLKQNVVQKSDKDKPGMKPIGKPAQPKIVRVFSTIRSPSIKKESSFVSEPLKSPKSLVKVYPFKKVVKLVPGTNVATLQNKFCGEELVARFNKKSTSPSTNKINSVKQKLNSTDNSYVKEEYKKENVVDKKCISLLKKNNRAFDSDRFSKCVENCNTRDSERVSKGVAIEDSDRMFLLSLTDELKRVPDVFKLDAKLEIMQVLKRYQNKTVGDNGNLTTFPPEVVMYESQTSAVAANVTIGSRSNSPDSIMSEEHCQENCNIEKNYPVDDNEMEEN